MDKKTNSRLKLSGLSEGFHSEVVLDPGQNHFFQARLDQSAFANLNKRMNERVRLTQASGYSGHRIKHQRIKETDKFYKDGTRVSVDSDGKVVRSIKKTTLKSIDILCPTFLYDFRISANTEKPVQKPVPKLEATHSREKDRLSYQFEFWSFDMTTVTMRKETSEEIYFEFEIEFSMEGISALKTDHSSKDFEHFQALTQAFINNIRSLLSLAVGGQH